ncbi:MAG: hypothetical protein ABW167_11585 [Baekduia sp.]
MTTKTMLAAAGTGVALAIASPAAAKTGTVELAMADYVQAKRGPDAAEREAALRERHARRAADEDCGDCDDCGGCGESGCAHCADCQNETVACADCEDAAPPADGSDCTPDVDQATGGMADA